MFDVYTPDILRCRKSGVLPVCQMLMAVVVSSVTTVALRVRYRLPDERQTCTVHLSAGYLENGVNLEQTIRLREEIAESTALWVR